MSDPWDMASRREQHRFSKTNEMLKQRGAPFSTILELGCGEGHQSQQLGELGEKLYGVDVSEVAIKRAKDRYPRGEFYAQSLEHIDGPLADLRFSLTTACEVLYYVKDPRSIIEDLTKRSDRIFVSNYLPRSEKIRHYFEDEGWERMDEIRFEDIRWECFFWSAPSR